MEPYSYCVALTDSGDYSLDNTELAGGWPVLEICKRVLNTPKGSFLPDPNFGLDTSFLRKIEPNTAVRFIAAVRAALRDYTSAGVMADLQIKADFVGDRLIYDISAVDPRASVVKREKDSIKGEIRV